MKTLLVAAGGDRAAALASRLTARGHAVTRAEIADARLGEKVDLLLVAASPDQAEALCRTLLSTARGRTPMTMFVGDPSPAELERLLRAGVDTFAPSDESIDLRLTVVEHAARDRALIADLTSELRESEDRYRSVLAAMQEGVLVLDAQGRILTCNASAARILDRPVERLMGRTLRDDTRPVVRADGTTFPETELPAYVTLATGKPVSDVVVGLRDTESGETTWLSVSSQPLDVRADAPPEAVVVSFTDTTDVRRSEANFRGLIERAPDGILVHRDGKVVFVNPKFFSMLGFGSASECVGRPLLDFVHPEDRAMVLEQVSQSVTTGEPAPPLVERLIGRSGEVVYVEVIGLPIHFDGVPATLAHARDMTERRRLEDELRAADRLASVGRLAAAVGHEINNPLAYVVGNLDLLDALLKGDVDAQSAVEARRLLADARDGAERVRGIVRDLKLFSKRDDDAKRAIDVRKVLESSLGIAWNEIRHRARVVKDYGDTPAVHGSEARLGQVFLNLLVNAAQAIPEGNAERHEVRVTTRFETPSAVVVEIRDTGVGIPPDVLRHVFEPFFTTKPAGAGTGLGLAICQTLVTSAGGTIAVDSEVGKGTRVRVTLPASNDQPSSSEPQPSAPPTSEPRYRLLIVDDEPRVAITLRHLLSEHEVTIVSSGREAIDQLGKADTYFDAILCDLMMGDLTGMDVFEVIKLARPGMQKRMIFMTGGAFTPRASTFVSTIENPCLEKPFPLDDLMRAIRKVVRETAAAQPLSR